VERHTAAVRVLASSRTSGTGSSGRSGSGVLSTQVLQEYFVTATRARFARAGIRFRAAAVSRNRNRREPPAAQAPVDETKAATPAATLG